MVNVVLAGGGTAGHTSPLIATAEALALASPDVSVTCIGTAKGLETRVIPEAGLELQLIPPVPMPRKPTLDLLRVPGRLRAAVREAASILRDADAQVLVGFGGYVSMPAYLAARQLKIPVVIHEQNAVPGLANRVASRFAVRVAVTFPDTPLRRAEVIGLPVRRALSDLAHAGRASRQEASRELFGLDSRRPTLLVSGGSQGARSINEALLAARDELLAAGVQILHVWGPKNFPEDAAVVTHPVSHARYVPVAYVDRMEQAYCAADLMLGRSGAGTVVETAIVGLPGVFVPLPHGNGEQARNAAALVAAGGAVLVPDAELTAARLVTEVLGRVDSPEVLADMAKAGRALMSADAAAELAAIVASVVGSEA